MSQVLRSEIEYRPARAVELLKTALAKGYSNVSQVIRDPGLSALRGRDDFAAMLWEIAEATPGQSKP